MLTKQWKSIQVQTPSEGIIPLPRLYGNGFFVSAVFGSEAWVINKKTFESQPMRMIGSIPDKLCRGMIVYNNKQYEKFLAKQRRLALRLSENRSHSE